MSGFVLSFLRLVESRLWSGPPPEPPQVIAQPQTGRVARLSYAKGYTTEVPRELFCGAECGSVQNMRNRPQLRKSLRGIIRTLAKMLRYGIIPTALGQIPMAQLWESAVPVLRHRSTCSKVT